MRALFIQGTQDKLAPKTGGFYEKFTRRAVSLIKRVVLIRYEI